MTRAASEAAALGDAAPDVRTFTRHLGAQLARATDPLLALERLHSRDLALALACAEGVPAARALLEQDVFLKLHVPLSRIHPSPMFVDEVLQVLRANLLMPRTDAPSRLLGYAGSGPLLHWVSISAVRLALRMRKALGDESLVDAEVLAAHPAPGGLELGFVREEARGHVRAAFIRAVASLDDEDRELLRLHFVERLSLERMGTLFGLHKSTLSRRLSVVQSLLEKRTRRALTERLSLPEPEVDSLMRAIQGRLDLSLSGLLEGRP
ncbi:transcriptional regulator [Myxococcus sp. K38C18041901]|uniref:transcriptional regulator n=1 Tax=Myxococcus guangdongensis TaxID=2906760 RepID=UPI0020A82038|nr:transcriptional regulator [Myxococcus guangdongensis]MCP3057836.1 transcriptional regulator [Myxococcus guangdongensis]